MRSAAMIAAAVAVYASPVMAEGPPLAHFAVPDTQFTDALGAQDLAIEALLNTSPDGARANAAKKGGTKGKASGTLFGAIRNNFGADICGLVLANGQFVFSCSPTGSYSLDTITDAHGLIGVFGFADGHFPYHTNIAGFGRWDITLNTANTSPPPQLESTITFNITDGCNNGSRSTTSSTMSRTTWYGRRPRRIISPARMTRRTGTTFFAGPTRRSATARAAATSTGASTSTERSPAPTAASSARRATA